MLAADDQSRTRRLSYKDTSTPTRMPAFLVETIAICTVLQDGTILRSTAGAQSLFATQSSGVLLHGLRLRVGDPDEQAGLDALIVGACCTGSNRGLDCPTPVQSNAKGHATILNLTASGVGAMFISRAAPSKPLHVIVFPFLPASLRNEPEAAALILFSDPFSKPKSRATILSALYNLTPTESRLSDFLMQGLELREAASQLRITIGTARFHLKRVLAKTGTRRQTELMRLMLSLPAA